MNSMSRGYYDPCRKEKREERREEKCPTIIKCGCPSSTPITTVTNGTPVSATIASLHLDTSCLCDPKIKLEVAANAVSGAFVGTISLQVFKQCKNQFTPVPVGPAWNSTIAAAASQILTFFVCDSDFCRDECCVYTVVATATSTTVGTVTFNNSTIGAIVACESNKCERCH